MRIRGSHCPGRLPPTPHPLARRLDHPDDPWHVSRLIEQAVASVFRIEAVELLRPSRGPAPVALARQIAMYLAHVVGEIRLSEIGRIFGRDRTTVAHACKLVEDRRDDPKFNRTLDLLENIIKRVRIQMFPDPALSV